MGGILVKVDPELRYIMLANIAGNIIWSVQLNESNVIFIPKEPKLKISTDQTDTSSESEDTYEVNKEKIKNILYKMYLNGDFNDCL